MKNAIKKAISVLLVAVMVFGIAPLAEFVGLELPELNLFSTKAEAASDGYYTYSVSNDEATITDVDTSISGDIIIPSTLGGYPVTTIGDLAFYNCTSLESVTIPDSVTTIDVGAFECCSNLVSVTIPDSITTICAYTFVGCMNLKRVTIPDSVTTIGNYAFELCQSLESVTIPDGVTSIGDHAFRLCQSLESITIPDSVTSIGDYAFGLCQSLESVVIPDSLTSIGESAFAVCPKLTRITVSSDNTAYSSDEHGALFDKNKTNLIQYPCGNGKTSYKIPDGVTSIGTFAFAGGFDLESVIIPESVEHIKVNAFYGCTSIEDVYYGSSKSDWEQIVIGGGNEIFDSARVHYNSTGPVGGGSSETPDNTPDYDSSVTDTFLVANPTETTISYGDSIVLHVDPAKIPEGGYVEWYPSNENFSYTVSSDGTTCKITSSNSGDTTFTALIYDAEGNIISADTQTMTSKAGFFQKILAFFKRIFGLTKVIPQ